MVKDMGPETTFCSHSTNLTKEQFGEQFSILAKLHGQFYETKADFFPTLLGTRERFMNNVRSLDIETVCGNEFKAAKEVIPPRLFAREAEVWPLTVKSVDRNDILPQTVVHSDVHLGEYFASFGGSDMIEANSRKRKLVHHQRGTHGAHRLASYVSWPLVARPRICAWNRCSNR